MHRTDKISISEFCLLSLPDELLLFVFFYLNALELLKISIVNQRFYKVSGDHSLWKKMGPTKDAFLLLLPSQCATILKKKLINIAFIGDEEEKEIIADFYPIPPPLHPHISSTSATIHNYKINIVKANSVAPSCSTSKPINDFALINDIAIDIFVIACEKVSIKNWIECIQTSPNKNALTFLLNSDAESKLYPPFALSIERNLNDNAEDFLGRLLKIIEEKAGKRIKASCCISM